MKLLLISNSTTPGQPYLQWPIEYIREFFDSTEGCGKNSGEGHDNGSVNDGAGSGVRSVVFVPYAAVTFSYDEYEARVRKRFDELGIAVRSVHHEKDPAEAVRRAEAIVVGGGNTFALLKKMHEQGLVEAIRETVMRGAPYVGWSAGSNVCCPTICTTNDMPIVEPVSFAAVGAVPFQINPHYLDSHPDGHAGETREQRIEEYIAANTGMYVAGLREGCLLLVESETNPVGSGSDAVQSDSDSKGSPFAPGIKQPASDIKITLVGSRPMRIFRHNTPPREVNPGDDLSFLIHNR